MENGRPESIERQRSSLINNYLGQIATATGTDCNKDRKALYCRGLSDLSLASLSFAFEENLKHLGKFLPSIKEIRTKAEQYRAVDPIAATREYLQRNDKPTDWAAIGARSGVTQADIDGWLESGKEAQREHAGRLEDDPGWRAMATRLGGFPGVAGSAAESAAASRNSKSEVPVDPAERRVWATEKARKQGWL